MKRPFVLQQLLLWLTLSCQTSMVLADRDADTAHQLREAGDILPLETILQRLQTHHPGKILEVELEQKREGVIYEIELLDENRRVWKYQVDARTGAILNHKQDD